MDKRTTSGRGEPIPSILKNSKARRKGDFLDKSSKIKREKVEGSKKSENVSTPLPQGCTQLMYACQQADYKTVVEILNKDPGTVRVRDRGLRCALHYCASSGAGASQAARANCADRVLMAAPALADARDADGLTPLHLAVVHGNVPLVQTLLAAGADVNARDDEHHTVVHWATVCGEVGALRAVLAVGADAATPDQHGGYPLHYAAQMCGAPAATDHQTRGAALEVLRALVKEGGARVDVRDADGRTPLLWAASAGSAAAVLALHQAGAKVDDADRDGLTALHCAAARGHTEALETLVGLCGARVDVADSHGCTPLHYAAALGHADATVALLQHGADPHRQDRKGRSPSHTAAAKGQIETLRILGARGANLWLRNAKGDLPLHEAVASGRRELVKWLLDGRPSQVNATNHEGRAPLHIAASSDNADLCKLLLDRGAEVNPVARSSKNEPLTPLDCATIKGHRSTAKYLQMHGGLPATKLTNTDIIIDGASITALPTRKVTSTKIDVRDRIRIEKKEVVEISSPLLEKRRTKNRDYSNSSDSSYSDDKRCRKKRSNQYAEKYYERRKRLIEPQKSFSDGYDTEKDFKAISKHKKKSKKNRSKSEPSKQNERSPRRRHRHYTDSYSSSDTQSYSERKKSKRHRRTNRRKSRSSSESSSSESSERRSAKRKNKKTSIHIENDDEKQKVNIVKYCQTSESDKNLTKDGNSQELVDVNVKPDGDQLVKNKTLSETETDNISVQTNMVVTEAQIHMERQSSQNGSSEITVTLDSLNNVSIETANLNVTHKNKTEETEKNITEKVEESQIEIRTETNNTDSTENMKNNLNHSISSENHGDLNENANLTKLNLENEERNLEIIDNEKQSVEAFQKEEQSVIDTQSNIKDAQNKDEVSGSTSENEPKIEKTRKKSFQVLSGPEDEFFDKNIDSEREIKTPQKISPSVSFANKDEVFESRDSDHLMGEEVDHNQTQDNKEADSSQSDSKKVGSEEKKAEYISGSSSSVEVTDNVKKGLITVLDSNVSTDRAIQQVLNGNAPEEILSQSSPRRSKSSSHGSEVHSRKSSIYETESYKVIEDMTTSVADVTTGILKKSKKSEEGSLDDDNNFSIDKLKDSFTGRVPSVSDNEIYSHSEVDGRRKRFRKKGRVKSRTTIRSRSENSERGYESSGLMDSGFEPSPRVVQRRIMSPRLAAYYQQRNASGKYSGKSDSRIPVRKPGDKHAVDMKSVTQRIQTNMRRYYCERKIFQHLLELKRLQIRTSKANEAVLVKRAIDDYNKSNLSTVGMGPYSNPDYSFSSFEKFLYESLRKLQKSGKKHLENLPLKPIDFDYGDSDLYKMSYIPDNPCLCTSKTHRCYHAVHAYTGIPCSAYIPYKWNHHTMPKPATAGGNSRTRGFLPKINSKPPTPNKAHVTLEVSHGTERQLIALPAEKLDKNKRYYVTFTVKGSEPPSDSENPQTNASVPSG